MVRPPSVAGTQASGRRCPRKQPQEISMPKESEGQRDTESRVMHEFKHGELKSGAGGKGGKVKSRKQAIAIALHEAGASRDQSSSQKKHAPSRTKAKEARGETAMQEKEGK